MADYVLETKKLTKKYGEQKAVDEIAIHVPKGAVYGLIGKNGAGKSTFMKMICGMANHTIDSDKCVYAYECNERVQEMIKTFTLTGGLISEKT